MATIEDQTVVLDRPPTAYELALEEVAKYQPEFTPIATRAERSRVNTSKGRQIFDQDVRGEYKHKKEQMDMLLEVLFSNLPEDMKGLPEPATEPAKPTKELTTYLFQLSTEPIPEYHDEYIVLIDKIDDEPTGRKF